MSNARKSPAAMGGRPRKDVLASLKMAQLEVSKPVLPAGKRRQTSLYTSQGRILC